MNTFDLTIRRMMSATTPAGVTTTRYVEETRRDLPAALCLNFQRDFPSAFVSMAPSVEPAGRTSDRRQRRSSGGDRRPGRRPTPAPTPRTSDGFSFGELIENAVREAR